MSVKQEQENIFVDFSVLKIYFLTLRAASLTSRLIKQTTL